MMRGFGVSGLELTIEKKGDPEHGKEKYVEPEHASPPPALQVFKQVRHGEFLAPNIVISLQRPPRW